MKELYELKDKLCEELKGYGKKELSAGSLDVIDKLAHAIKNLDKVLENSDEEYSGRYPMYDNGYARGRSRDSMGRYSSRNGYSNGNDLMNEVREMMSREPNESKRQAMQDFINRMSQF